MNSSGFERLPRPDAHIHSEPLTFGQRLLWALDRVRGGSGALNCPMVCTIEGPLAVAQVQRALNLLVSAHSALRTTVVPGRMPHQAFHGELAPALVIHDLVAEPRRAPEVTRRELSTRVDVTSSPVRVSLLRLTPERHTLIVNVHHVVTDLWSSNVLFEDLARALDPSASGVTGGSSWDNRSFSRWEREQIEAGAFGAHQRYWFERLVGMCPLPVPLAATRADSAGSTGLIESTIDATDRLRLEALARERRSSAFAVLLAVLYGAAFLDTGQRDLTVLSLFANRSRPELKRTVAFLVSPLMLRVRLPPAPRFIDIIDQTQRAIGGALKHVDLPFHALSPPPPRVGKPGIARADDLVFHATTEPLERSARVGALVLRSVVPEVVGRFDLELAVRARAQSYVVRLTFNERRIDATAARALLERYVDAARALTTRPEAPLQRRV